MEGGISSSAGAAELDGETLKRPHLAKGVVAREGVCQKRWHYEDDSVPCQIGKLDGLVIHWVKSCVMRPCVPMLIRVLESLSPLWMST